MRLRGFMQGALPLLVLACSHSAASPDPLEMSPLVDVNPDPNVVEVNLVATTGTHPYLAGKPPAQIWGYRDGSIAGSKPTVPGPMLVAKRGDLVIVHFRNELPESTTIHWHGIRLTEKYDGSSASQSPVFPGDSFDYYFYVRDAGTFWYHPHMRADVQIQNGLYGAILVHGDPATPDVAADRTFILDDVKLAASGQLDPVTDSMDMMMGRQGNVLLVNGTPPDRAAIDVKKGSRERWRFVDSANGRFFDLRLADGTPLTVIGWDGGMIPEPYAVSDLLIAPGERYDVLVQLDADADTTLQTVYYDRGHDLPDPGPLDLLAIRYRGAVSSPPAALPSTWGIVDPLPVSASTRERTFTLSEDMSGPDPLFYINGEQWPFDTPVSVLFGDTEIWKVVNDSEMDHPFHLHGMFFQVLDRDGVPETRLGNKDTVIVKKLSTVRFAVQYTSPGMWMYHCHILEHAERGMMGDLMVVMPPPP